ncbi:MAG: PQQ-binding-like beta-propeller repeat protein [Acidobacteriota bacterium]
MKSQHRPRDRRIPPLWVRLLLATPLAVILWLQTGDRMGDSGLTTVMTAFVFLIFLLIATVWFVFFSGFSRKFRLLSVVGGVVVIAMVATLFRYDGVTGSMRPVLRFRFGADPDLTTPLPSLVAGPIDLATTTPFDFPGFLGPRRDGAVENVELARSWGRGEPRAIWRHPIGAGWSGFAVVNGHAVTMEQRGASEVVSAYNVNTGDLEWSHAHPGRFDHPLGGLGPRSTPFIHEGLVYALGASGWLVCLDGATGALVWEKDLLEVFGITPEQEFASIQYGRSNSPLVRGDLLIIPAGGNVGGHLASLVAFDARTGESVWEGGHTQISFSSPSMARLAGREQILIVNESTLGGFDPASGQLLWEHPWPGVTSATASSSQAVAVPPDRVFVSKGYGGGAMLLRLAAGDEGRIDVTQVWKNNRVLRTKFTNVVIHDGAIYGLSDSILECVDLATGRRLWKRGRYGHGQILRVGDLLLVLTEDGEVVLVELSAEDADHELGRFEALSGKSWNNLALYDDLLVIRNGQEAAAYRLPLAGG